MDILIYEQRTGKLTLIREGGNPERIAVGYSGQPPYVNDPDAQALKARGPIPRGHYRVGGAWDHVRLGPCVMFLEPMNGQEMHGRSGFLIHGDNSYGNRTASHGCIILDRKARERVASMTASKKPLVLEVIEG